MTDEELNLQQNRLFKAGASLYERRQRSSFNVFLNVVIVFFCVILVLELFFNLFYMGIYVVNVSMEPTLMGADNENVSGGEFIYLNKYAKPDYGDIVVVYREEERYGTVERGNIIKRVVAFGGDSVRMENGILYVNEKEVDESYLNLDEIIDKLAESESAYSFDTHVVKEGCMFLLGDNRNRSTDSRPNRTRSECIDYPADNLVGVVPDWSMSVKSFTTGVYTFFNFTLWGK